MGGIDANGKPTDNRTPEQKDALTLLLHKLKQMFLMQRLWDIGIFGAQISQMEKMCPCFNAIEEYKDIA